MKRKRPPARRSTALENPPPDLAPDLQAKRPPGFPRGRIQLLESVNRVGHDDNTTRTGGPESTEVNTLRAGSC